jgi:hypothetical protein
MMRRFKSGQVRAQSLCDRQAGHERRALAQTAVIANAADDAGHSHRRHNTKVTSCHATWDGAGSLPWP